MGRYHWISRVAAILLCFVVVGQLLVLPVCAAEIQETEVNTIEEYGTVSEDEESETVESSVPELVPAEDEPEEYIESGDEELLTQKYRITGFQPLSEAMSQRVYSYEGKPSEAEVVTDLPEYLEVYLDNGDTVFEMPVDWKGIGNYDETGFFYYEFDPVWDEDVYVLDTQDVIPYIGIYLDRAQLMSVSGSENETIIYDYLIHEMGLNTAAACGVLANIKCESDFNPNQTGDYINGVYTSYGICQWHNDRLTALQNYTDQWETLEGQLDYLNYELNNDPYYSKVLTYLKGVSNDALGCYDAAYYWCYYFETPADTANTAVTRGKLAQNTYWPYYSTGNVVISGGNAPGTLNKGESFEIQGTLSSDSIITSVTAGVYNVGGSMKTGATVTPNTYSYELSSLDSEVRFGSLSAGVYRYKVTAKNSVGTTTLVNKVFVVLADESTIEEDTYYVSSMTDATYMAAVEGGSSLSGANICLKKSADSNYMKFSFEYQSNGYYKIRNLGSNKCLGITDGASASGSNVEQQAEGVLWQVLPDESGAWYLVPQSAVNCCFDLKSNTIADGQNIDIYTANMTTAQRWKLTTISAGASIVGATEPGTMAEGSSFDIRGTITSGSAITSVTVGVYDAAGNMKIGKTVSPNTTTYDLKNVDTSIKFGTLTAGIYRYKVIAVSGSGTAVLVNKVFVVTGTGQTVADGTYHIASMTNSDYVLSIKSDSNTEGANVHLWKKASTNYMKFQFIYDGNGYYKIRNAGSGKYLGVAGQSSSSGANVEQQTGGTLWMVLSDGTGAYYLVPKTAMGNCLDLSGNTIANGKNIDIYTANMTTAQRWKLNEIAEVVAQKPTISGATIPGTMSEGSSFSIRGTISSNVSITSVTVGVYDVKGNMKIGKTVSPNATTYDLVNVDTSVKFGTLAAGVYRYRVTAVNAAGTTELVNKVFVVTGTGQTVANGIYHIASVTNGNYALSIKSDSNTTGANVHLWKKASTNYMKFQFIYNGSGYYKIKDVGSGKYLGVTGQSSSSGANVEQQTDGTLWQVLSDGNGAYYLIPKTATGCCLDLSGNTVANGRNIDIYTANMTTAQRWKLENTAVSQKATISGATIPGTMSEGSSFSIRGTVSSDSNITSVTVGVYDVSGSMKIGKKVEPDTTAYDLKNIDTSIKFGTLAAGIYRYKVMASNGAGTAELVDKVFVVTATGQTVANGTYYIASMTNSGYVLSIKSDSNTAGANVHLWKKTSTNYMKFQFTYSGSGYYKIKDVGSGKYLGVADQSSSSGANVEQQTDGTLWQVLSDETGAWYLVPKTATGSCLDLSGNKVENGRNIDIYTANMTTAQRWKLQ